MLERWITGYAETLRPTLYWGTYKLWNEPTLPGWHQLNLLKDDGQWGGEAAAEMLTDYLKPATLYANEKHTAFRKLRLVPDNEGYLFLYLKFWKDDRLDMEDRVPPLLVYADCNDNR